MRIPGLRGLSPSRLLKHAIEQFRSHGMTTHAAALTYHLLFSLFPFIIFFIALLGFFDLSNLFDWLRRQFESILLEQTTRDINRLLDRLQERRLGMLSFGVAVALWAASSAMRSIMSALNAVYQVKEARPLWKRYAQSLLYTLTAGSMTAIAIVLMLVAPQAMQTLAQYFGVERIYAVL